MEKKSTEPSFSMEKESFVFTSKEVNDVFGLECEICNEPYKLEKNIPKLLPCGHTFCLACLEKIPVKTGTLKVTSHGNRGFGRNSYNETADVIPCPTCRELVRAYNLNSLPNDHKIVKGWDAISIAKDRFRNVCVKHDCRSLDRFCRTCREPICSDCIILSHNETDGHAIVDPSEELNANERRFDYIEEQCEARLNEMKARSAKLSNIKTDLQNTVVNEMAKIEKEFAKYRKLIEDRKESLVAMVEEKVRKRTSELTDEALCHHGKMKKLQSTFDIFRASRDNGDVRALFKSEKEIIEHETTMIKQGENRLDEVGFEFTSAREDIFLLELVRLGDVQETKK